ncbi:MAG: RNA polymerase subunit sigma [Actinobacteria bacterium 13_2_20CM_2_71_6]|nr:MAG: RNA polymerase subunit sigma [Actinobacteria bacterium 13_2_20CM_2_71_6]
MDERTERGLADALVAAREGDQAGFALLWRAHQPGILRYLRVVVGTAAEDVASETWLQVARDLSRYRGDPAGFRVWLFRVARHRAIDDRRRIRRRPEELAEPEDIPQPAAADAGEESIEHLDTEWALRVIATLPRDQAEAVLLRVVVGLDVAGTAAVLGKRPGAVRVAALRGLRRLAERTEVQQRRLAARSASREGV